jgi:hypothetical protein
MPLDQLQAFVRAGQMALKDPDYMAAMRRQTGMVRRSCERLEYQAVQLSAAGRV